MRSRIATLLLLFFAGRSAAHEIPAPPTTSRPNIRTITAFVRIDPVHYRDELAEAQGFLSEARAAFAAEGWGVESVRITTQPFPEYVAGLSPDAALSLLLDLDALAVEGGYGLDIGPGMRADGDDPGMLLLLERFLAVAQTTNASVHLVASWNGVPQIQWGVVREAVKVIRYLSQNSPEGQANFNFAATAVVPPYSPFYPASWHDGPGRQFAIGLESANVIGQVFAATGYDPASAGPRLAAELLAHAAAVEGIARGVESRTRYSYLGIDTTPAPFDEVASIGAALESFTGGPLGTSGTLTGAAVVTQVVRSLPIKRVGLEGLFLPVLEDSRIALRFGEGRLSIDSLLSYSSVCGTGLDTLPLPGEVSDDQLAKIVGDVASLAAKWQKPLTARLLPVPGRTAGETTQFESPFLTNTVLQPLP